jgi:hypothetical protein
MLKLNIRGGRTDDIARLLNVDRLTIGMHLHRSGGQVTHTKNWLRELARRQLRATSRAYESYNPVGQTNYSV